MKTYTFCGLPSRFSWVHIIAFLGIAMLPFTTYADGWPVTVSVEVAEVDLPYEVSWHLEDAEGNIVISGGAPFVGTVDLIFSSYYYFHYDDDGYGDWNLQSVLFKSPYSDFVYYTPGGNAVIIEPGVIEFPFFITDFGLGCGLLGPQWGDLEGLPNPGYLSQGDFDMTQLSWFHTASLMPQCCTSWGSGCQGTFEAINSLFLLGATIYDTIPEIIPAPEFNPSRKYATLANGFDEDALNCASADIGQSYLWFRFNATHTNTLVSARREGAGNFNGVIEVYEGWGGTPIVCQDDYSTANEVAVFPTEIGQRYYIKVYHNGATVLTNPNISVGVAFVPTAELRVLDCGLMNLTDASIIRSNWPVNNWLLQNWTFRFEELEAPYNVYEVLSPNGSNPQFRWFWFPQREPGRTYEVRTRALMYQGPTWADYGEACIIGTAPAGSGSPAGMIAAPGSTSWTSDEMGMQLWPNPSQGEVNISFAPGAEDRQADITVFDISGKEIDRIQHNFDRGSAQNITYSIDRLVAGIYLFHIRTQSATSVGRLVVTTQ